MKRVRLTALALLCASSAAGQQRSPTAGVPQPAQSFAMSDDATALAGNPAALGFTQGLLLEYAGVRGYGTGMFRGDGAYFSAAGWGAALGASLEWLHQSSECTPLTPCARRFSLGAAMRAGSYAVGVAHHGFSSDESAALDNLGSWDLGVLARPRRWLSLGYTAVDVNGPSLGGVRLPRRHVAAVAEKPLTARTACGAAKTLSAAEATL